MSSPLEANLTTQPFGHPQASNEPFANFTERPKVEANDEMPSYKVDSFAQETNVYSASSPSLSDTFQSVPVERTSVVSDTENSKFQPASIPFTTASSQNDVARTQPLDEGSTSLISSDTAGVIEHMKRKPESNDAPENAPLVKRTKPVKIEDNKYFTFLYRLIAHRPTIPKGKLIRLLSAMFIKDGEIPNDFPTDVQLSKKIGYLKGKVKKKAAKGELEAEKMKFEVREARDQAQGSLETSDLSASACTSETGVTNKTSIDDEGAKISNPPEKEPHMYSTISIVDLRCMFVNNRWSFPANLGL